MGDAVTTLRLAGVSDLARAVARFPGLEELTVFPQRRGVGLPDRERVARALGVTLPAGG